MFSGLYRTLTRRGSEKRHRMFHNVSRGSVECASWRGVVSGGRPVRAGTGRAMGGGMKNVTAKRLPKYWTSIAADCRAMTRFDFIALFVAHQTKTAAGRECVSGMQVVQVDGGWRYGFADVGASCGATDSERLWDMIRRTSLGYFVRAAETYRDAILMAA